jgi:hypothetical protein
MIPVWTAAARDGWHHLVTGDESRFFFPIVHAECRPSSEMTSLQSRVPIFERNLCMFTVIRNLLGFCVLDKLSSGAKIDSDSFPPNLLRPLEQKVFSTGRNPYAKRLTIHLENCSIHTGRSTEQYIRQQNTRCLQHPPYWPDLMSSDFYLFPTIKKNWKIFRWSTKKSCFIGCRKCWTAFATKNCIRSLGHGSTGSWL